MHRSVLLAIGMVSFGLGVLPAAAGEQRVPFDKLPRYERAMERRGCTVRLNLNPGGVGGTGPSAAPQRPRRTVNGERRP